MANSIVTIGDYGWLKLNKYTTKRRVFYTIEIPYSRPAAEGENATLWPNDPFDRDKKMRENVPPRHGIKQEVINHFDPGKNRIIGFRYTWVEDAEITQSWLCEVQWKFRDLKKAKDSIFYALLKWNKDTFYKKLDEN